jgi:ectoine hydroxylase-related dioxygenase (phytanoyl-CoA dioxygenase family)
MPDIYLEQYEKDGYAVVKGLFSASETAEIAKSFDTIYAEAMTHERSYRMQNVFFGITHDDLLGRIVRMVQWPSYINKDLERIRRDPRILEILEPLLGANLKQIINQMHWKPPGASMVEFGFHQDAKSRRPREAYTDLATSYLQTAIAVDPHREENGAMVVCPGSHHLGELPFDPKRSSMQVNMDDGDLVKLGVDPEKSRILELDPGDFAFWSVNTLHGSGPNRSNIDRRLYINGYVIAENCERGEWAFRDGDPCPLSGEPALVHYEDLHNNPDPHYVD